MQIEKKTLKQYSHFIRFHCENGLIVLSRDQEHVTTCSHFAFNRHKYKRVEHIFKHLLLINFTYITCIYKLFHSFISNFEVIFWIVTFLQSILSLTQWGSRIVFLLAVFVRMKENTYDLKQYYPVHNRYKSFHAHIVNHIRNHYRQWLDEKMKKKTYRMIEKIPSISLNQRDEFCRSNR